MVTAASTEARLSFPSPRQQEEMGSGPLSPRQQRGGKRGGRCHGTSAVLLSLATHIPRHGNRESQAAGQGGVGSRPPLGREGIITASGNCPKNLPAQA